jgi:DNA end-binding protein Ku
MKGARPTWKGSLKLSLIAVPIRVYPATTTAPDVAFRQLHRRCHTPIQIKKWCPHCHEEVSGDQIVRGYETSKNHYVLVEDDEVEALRPDTTHVIALSHIISAARIGPIHVERTYFLTPDTKEAGAAFAVLRDALDGQAAIGRVALHGREYLVAVEAFEAALIMYTLRTAGEVRDLSATDGVQFATAAKVKTAEVTLARQILGTLTTARDVTAFTDHYEESLRAMLVKKRGGDVAAPIEPGPGKVVDLMQALRASLAAVGTRKSARAKAGSRQATVIAHPSSRRRRARRAS